jgi:glutamate-1-semialdehyde 2,1-aminomutase
LKNAIEQCYRSRTPKSEESAGRAERVMPGGDTRTISYYEPYPLTLTSGEGAFVTDADGNRYIDLLGNYTSLVHGHAYPPISEAIAQAARRGTAWPARSEQQIELAELLCARVPSVERVRLCNSGTEAGMIAAQVARHLTGRKLLLMARCGYHGSYDDLEFGLAQNDGERTLIGDFGDAAAFERILETRGREIAAVFLEPVLGSGGIIVPPPGFLDRVGEAARRAGALFVLDEVITLRLSTGGAQQIFGVRPDLTMMGKIIGGGLPVGALGGSVGIMECFDPRKAGSILHSGTFNGNPLTCEAGVVSMRELKAERIVAMDRLAARLKGQLERAAVRLELRATVRQAGSLLNVVFTAESDQEAARMHRDFHLAALNHGVFIAPRGMIALSTVMNAELVDEAGERLAAALANMAGNN